MSNWRMLVRPAIALAPAIGLLIVGAVANDDTVASMANAAALIFLAVLVFESFFGRPAVRQPATSSQRDDSSSDPLASEASDIQAGITALIAYAGVSTPTIARAARGDKSESVLSGWLDLVAARLGALVGQSCGVMVVREAFALRSEDLVPYCQVEFRGGSPQCTLPLGSHIPVSDGVEVGIAEYAGARSLYLTSLDTGDDRYWLCLTFAAPFAHHGLDPLCDAMTGPVGVAISALTAAEGTKRLGLSPLRIELLAPPSAPVRDRSD